MTIRLGLCHCGCGRETNTAPDGEPRRFIRGHNRRGTSVGWMEQGRWFISVNGRKIAYQRYVVELRDGRKLTGDGVVHHVDGDPLNNDPENLVVLSKAEHMRLHRLTDNTRRWTEEEKARATELRRTGMTIQKVAWALGRSYSGTRDQLAKLHPSMSHAQRPSRAVPQGARVPVTARTRCPATEPNGF
jgi:transposase-like protein